MLINDSTFKYCTEIETSFLQRSVGINCNINLHLAEKDKKEWVQVIQEWLGEKSSSSDIGGNSSNPLKVVARLKIPRNF